jgi:hypothetical protein
MRSSTGQPSGCRASKTVVRPRRPSSSVTDTEPKDADLARGVARGAHGPGGVGLAISHLRRASGRTPSRGVMYGDATLASTGRRHCQGCQRLAAANPSRGPGPPLTVSPPSPPVLSRTLVNRAARARLEVICDGATSGRAWAHTWRMRGGSWSAAGVTAFRTTSGSGRSRPTPRGGLRVRPNRRTVRRHEKRSGWSNGRTLWSVPKGIRGGALTSRKRCALR